VILPRVASSAAPAAPRNSDSNAKQVAPRHLGACVATPCSVTPSPRPLVLATRRRVGAPSPRPRHQHKSHWPGAVKAPALPVKPQQSQSITPRSSKPHLESLFFHAACCASGVWSKNPPLSNDLNRPFEPGTHAGGDVPKSLLLFVLRTHFLPLPPKFALVETRNVLQALERKVLVLQCSIFTKEPCVLFIFNHTCTENHNTQSKQQLCCVKICVRHTKSGGRHSILLQIQIQILVLTRFREKANPSKLESFPRKRFSCGHERNPASKKCMKRGRASLCGAPQRASLCPPMSRLKVRLLCVGIAVLGAVRADLLLYRANCIIPSYVEKVLFASGGPGDSSCRRVDLGMG
jgi:hypothetical protein